MLSPASPCDRTHKLRVLYGNGLRPNLWEDFTRRFGVTNIAEFYGSTEGNANVLNVTGKVGAVGCIHLSTPLRPLIQPLYVVRVDKETYEPVRGEDGFCVMAEPGQHKMPVTSLLVQGLRTLKLSVDINCHF